MTHIIQLLSLDLNGKLDNQLYEPFDKSHLKDGEKTRKDFHELGTLDGNLVLRDSHGVLYSVSPGRILLRPQPVPDTGGQVGISE